MIRVPPAVHDLPHLPAYVYDLAALRAHAAHVRTSLAGAAEIFYAVKANPDPRILAALDPFVDGFEVSSGGELDHVVRALPGARLAFGGPGKTDEDLNRPVDRLHVESPHELARLSSLGHRRDVLLRVNLPFAASGAALTMSGPFGMDPAALGACIDLLGGAPRLRLRGMHCHLASGLPAPALLEMSERILRWTRTWLPSAEEINLGGGMAVDYRALDSMFDWRGYGAGLSMLKRPGELLRIEPGRALTAYCGWYVSSVIDVKSNHGEWYAVLRGGTHHLRTPVTKGHDQPFSVLSRGRGSGPSVSGEPVTLVGQLCTPKDVFARRIRVERIAAGDVVAFAMAGAYAWNISHHDFLMHPKPDFVYLDP